MRRILPTLVLLLTSACSSSSDHKRPVKPDFPQTNQQLFSEKIAQVPSINSLISLTPVQILDIQRFVGREEIAELPKNKQVYEYLSKNLVNFNYEGENYSASLAMDKQGGNCMSLALLTYAVAKQLGVKAVFQVMYTEPMLLEVTANLAVTSDHVRTFLYEEDTDQPSKSFFFSGRSYLVLDYFPGRYDRPGKIIDENQFVAMLYRNLAADALLNDDLDYAYSLLTSGIRYDEEYAPLISMMAIIHRRKGDVATADKLYRYGLEVTDSKISLLSNYHYLLSKQGNTLQAAGIKQQLLALEDTSPYDWYLIGQDSLHTGDFKSAEIYLSKFLKNTPYYHQAYFDLARAQFAQGKQALAASSIKQAIEIAELSKSQRRYKAKLLWLQQM
ncbi:hypothetical protein MK852_14640 [Shewanella benthica]|uniref:tetratricopeptide repeat protein n=1 Tax=Shewanella benthica TaxID=43661 RepID=UPI00187A81F3|nr:hypothetical protein [Shewanella benthica]MBE7215800.1 hypothetical protein [Shewanella benthica]MCL1063347.1 hypothetical protein [Shewanella benthica]